MIKRYAALIIAVLVLLVSTPIYVFAADANSPHYENAVDLKLLGLLGGTGNGFELERASSRIEGAVMLVRLLGKEQYAVQSHFSHPFKDVPSWADIYIGYMYNIGLTAGMSADIYGSSLPLSASQYATFVLRALGYYESENDFTSDTALEKAIKVGLLSTKAAEDFKVGGEFTRDSIVMISYNALSSKVKGLSTTLLDKLVTEDKAVSEITAEILRLYTSRLAAYYGHNSSFKPASTSYGLAVKNKNELTSVLKNTISALQPQVKIDMRSYSGDVYKDIEQSLNTAVQPVSKETGVADLIKGWRYKGTDTSFTLNITYRYTTAAFETEKLNYRASVNKARHMAVKLNRSMTDFDKELALHNYLVNNCAYDYEGYKSGSISENSFKVYGCLVLGKAVCQGYSESMKLLCDLSGLECKVITGKSYSSGIWEGHSWNMIKLEDNYYHLDTTFDDPIMESGKSTLSYCYFNLSDSEIKTSHQWDETAYPKCSSLKYNYYNANNLIVANKDELRAAIKRDAASYKPSMEFKITGFTAPQYTDMQKIISDSANASKYFYSVNNRFGVVKIFDLVY